MYNLCTILMYYYVQYYVQVFITYHYVIYDKHSDMFSWNKIYHFFSHFKLPYCSADKLVSEFRRGTQLTLTNVIWVSHLALNSSVYFLYIIMTFRRIYPLPMFFFWMHNRSGWHLFFFCIVFACTTAQWLGQWIHN